MTDVLTRLGLNESDIDRIADLLLEKASYRAPLPAVLTDSDVRDLAALIRSRALERAQASALAELVFLHLNEQALLGCTGGNPHCGGTVQHRGP